MRYLIAVFQTLLLRCIQRSGIIWVALMLCWAHGVDAREERMRVVFLNPSSQQDWFWAMTTDFLMAAAEDLRVDVEVFYADRNHILAIQQGRDVLNRPSLPDYVLTGNDKRSAGPIIELAETCGVDVFIFNNGFVQPQDIERYGMPRQHYRRWIGQYIPDNYAAGYKIGEVLIRNGLARSLSDKDGRFNIIALAGSFATHASSERVRGLEEIVAAHAADVSLLQVIPGDWSEKTARLKSQLMFKRYARKRIGAVWGANDAMVFGAINSANEIGITPGKDMLFGSCGWYTDAIRMVKRGTLTTTVGGHYMDGAWSLILLYDYHHGLDFIDDPVKSEMNVIDSGNVDRYLSAFGQEDWRRIDFTLLSKALNPSLKHYDFGLETVFEAMR